MLLKCLSANKLKLDKTEIIIRGSNNQGEMLRSLLPGNILASVVHAIKVM